MIGLYFSHLICFVLDEQIKRGSVEVLYLNFQSCVLDYIR